MSTNWDDPCAALAALRPVYYDLIAGKARVTVSFADRSVTYTPASITVLREEIARLQGQCSAKNTGAKPARYAMTAGGRFRWQW